MKLRIHSLAVLVGLFLIQGAALASLRPEKVLIAENKKVQAYIRDGLITGGDRLVQEVSVREIRRATNSGFERIVLDLDTKAGSTQRAPYYQIAVNPEERRLVVTLWGKPKLTFNASRVKSAFKKSRVIQGVELYPRIEEDYWTFVLSMSGNYPVEVFELSQPTRIIIDIKR